MGLPLVTERLTLRWPIESDFADLCTLWTDPRVARFMDDYGPRDEPAVREWLDTHLAGGGQDPSHIQLILTRRTDSAVVGWLGLGTSQDPLADWNFGYAVHPSHRANGYATEALKSALTYCHTELSISTLWGECHQANKASAHVMTNAGMQETTPTPTSRRFLYPPTPDGPSPPTRNIRPHPRTVYPDARRRPHPHDGLTRPPRSTTDRRPNRGAQPPPRSQLRRPATEPSEATAEPTERVNHRPESELRR